MTTLPSWFKETDYLESKLAQLKASGNTQITNIVELYNVLAENGYTPYDHFQAYGSVERTSPNKLFQASEYLEAKAKQMNGLPNSSGDWTADTVALAIQQAGLTIWQHFEQYGWAEGVNPSNRFDIKAYMAAKLAQMQDTDPSYTEEQLVQAFKDAGLSPISHYEAYGKAENIPVTEVPPADQVTPGGGQNYTLTAGIDVLSGTSGNDTFHANNATWNVGDSLDGGAGVDTLKIANENQNLTLAGRTLTNIENLTITNVDPDTGDQNFNFANQNLKQVTIDFAGTEHLRDVYLGSLRADTDLIIENVISDGNGIYRNGAGTYSTIAGSVTQNNTLRNIDYSVNDSDIEFENYSYFSAATELNLTTSVENLITGGTTTTGSDAGLDLYNEIEMQADNAVINLTYNLTNVLQPGDYTEIEAYIANGATADVADTVNVTLNIDNVDGLDVYVDAGENSGDVSTDNDVVTINVGAGGLANTSGSNYLNFDGFETINITIDGDTVLEDLDVYYGATAEQTINIQANADLTIEDLDAADDQKVTINILGAGNVTFDMHGDNEGVTVNAADATGNLDLGVGSVSTFETVVTSGSGDDTIALLNAFELNADSDAFLQVLDGGDGVDTFEIDTDDLEDSIALLGSVAGAPDDFSDAIINFERLSLTNFTDQAIDATLLDLGGHVTIDGYSTGGSLTVEDGATVVVTGAGTADAEIIVDGAGAGTADSLNLTVNGVDGIKLAALTVADVETINLVSSASAPDATAPGGNEVELLADETVTLNISGATELDLTGSTFVALETVNAAGFDAGLTIDVSGAAQGVTITTGAGADVVIGSDHNDVITVGDGGNTITGGLGLDTINLGGGATTADVDTIIYTVVGDSQGTTVDVINGFQVGVQATDDDTVTINDVLDFSAITFTQPASYVGEAAGYGAVLTSLQSGKSHVVLDSTTSILYLDVNADGALTDDDMAIQLTGVTELSAANFVFV